MFTPTTHATLSDTEFLRIYERLVRLLKRMHPDRSDTDLVHALRQAIGLTEASGNGRLITAALILLG